MEPCPVTDRCGERANDALGEGLDLEEHEASGHAQHDEGGEVAESEFAVARNIVDLRQFRLHCRDQERGDDVDEQRNNRVEE